MERRVGVIAVFIDQEADIPTLNQLFTQYSSIILGRMGLPIHSKHINVISLIVCGTTDEIGALTGKLGKISGIQVKSVLTRSKEIENDQTQ